MSLNVMVNSCKVRKMNYWPKFWLIFGHGCISFKSLLKLQTVQNQIVLESTKVNSLGLFDVILRKSTLWLHLEPWQSLKLSFKFSRKAPIKTWQRFVLIALFFFDLWTSSVKMFEKQIRRNFIKRKNVFKDKRPFKEIINFWLISPPRVTIFNYTLKSKKGHTALAWTSL